MKESLVAEGVVTLGRGRGGSVALVGDPEPQPTKPEKVKARARSKPVKAAATGGDLGFEAELFKAGRQAARQHGAVGLQARRARLIFLKAHLGRLRGENGPRCSSSIRTAPRTATSTRLTNVFWVPPTARWSHLQANAKQPTIGTLVDEAMLAIEVDNDNLKGVLPKDYARPSLNAVMLAS